MDISTLFFHHSVDVGEVSMVLVVAFHPLCRGFLAVGAAGHSPLKFPSN